MDISSVFQTFINAIVTTIGAFIPIFFLMYIHYRIRKNSYRKTKTRLLKAREAYQKLVDISEDVMQKVFISANVKNFQELLDNPKGLSNLDKFQYAKIVNYVNENLDQKIKNLDKMTKITLDTMYIDSYDFTTYIGNILDKRFPDKRF